MQKVAFCSKVKLAYKVREEGDNYFVDVYKYHMDFTEEDIKLQTEETNAFQIADAAQLSEYDKQGIFLHYQSIKQALQ